MISVVSDAARIVMATVTPTTAGRTPEPFPSLFSPASMSVTGKIVVVLGVVLDGCMLVTALSLIVGSIVVGVSSIVGGLMVVFRARGSIVVVGSAGDGVWVGVCVVEDRVDVVLIGGGHELLPVMYII